MGDTMAAYEIPSHQLLLRKNFKSSLHAFKRLIEKIRDQNRTHKSDSDDTDEAVIKYNQFHDAVKTFFGQDVISKDIAAFFQKITKHPDAPVDWTEIFGCFQTEESIIDLQTDPENTIFWLSKRETIGSATGGGKKKRDIIRCVVKVPALDSVLTVSQNGTISLFNNQMRQYDCIHAAESSWFLGCDFLNRMKKVVAVTERSIVFWDYKCHEKKQYNYTCIRPMEHCLRCVCTVDSQEDSVKDEILIGDEAGFVSLFSIASFELNPPYSKSKVVSQPVVLDSGKFKQFRRQLHNDCVVKVKYIQELNCFASISYDSKLSLVLDSVQRIKDGRPVRGFSVDKGITAFAFCVKANMIVTGGPDKVLRLWSPNVTNKPMAKLCGHLYSIADIAVNEQDQHVISVSTAQGFRVWDIQTLSLLQVFTDTQQKPGDCLINSMVFDNKNLRLLTGSCVLDVWPLTRMIQNTRQVPHSHDWSINALVYNQVFHQVLSTCSGSVLKVWEMETGVQVYEIKDPHGPTIEVTTAAIDIGGFYFATGANNGSVKMWEFGNGYQVKVLQPKKGYKDEEQGICQLSYKRTHDNQHMIIALDISGNIQMIQAKEDDPTLFVVTEIGQDTGIWNMLQSTQKKQTEQNVRTSDRHDNKNMSPIRKIICFDVVKLEKCFLIATGSIYGEISLYSLEASSVQHIQNSDESVNNANLENNLKAKRINKVLFIFPKEVDSLNTSRSSSSFQDIPRPNSLQEKMKTLEACTGECSAIDVDRGAAESHEPTSYSGNTLSLDDSPLIVSGHENGHLCLWNIKGDLISKELLFTKHPPNPVTALCSNMCANIIIAGTEEGLITLWKLYKTDEDDEKTTMMLKQELFWRAHSIKITSLFYEDSKNIVVSASEDNSIRLWHASRGNYIGYFGQKRAYKLIKGQEFSLPCDINELPVQTKSVPRTTKNFEFPLIHDRDKPKSLTKHKDTNEECVEVKYFKCLSSPKDTQRFLKSSRLEIRVNGPVFGALPLYQMQSINFGNEFVHGQQCEDSRRSISKTTKDSLKVLNPHP